MQKTNILNDKEKELYDRSLALEGANGTQLELFRRYREIYFMTAFDSEAGATKPPPAQLRVPKGIDPMDFKLTVSPSGRNEVVGHHRLLNTAELQVTVMAGESKAPASAKIERALKKIVEVSGRGKRARIESDANLSVALYGPLIMPMESVKDKLAVEGMPVYMRSHLEKLSERVPFTMKVINPEESFQERDEGLMIFHSHKYKLKGSVIKARWNRSDAKDQNDYVVRDMWDPEYHLIHVDGLTNPVIVSGATQLEDVPVASSYSGGSELFHRSDQQVNSFLYAKAKGQLDYRDNAILTAIFTAVSVRGLLGPLVAIDPDSPDEGPKVDFRGHIRTIRAKATPIEDKVIDETIFAVRNMLEEMSGQSTIYRQTLGENIDQKTFSGLAMLSSAGKLPMVDPKRALEQAFKDAFEHMLYRIKNESIVNPLIEPKDIPDDFELIVKFEPRLPQDNLRNAQIAETLENKVSDEWIQTNILQIEDTPAMKKQIRKEKIYKVMLEQMFTRPDVVEKFVAAIEGRKPMPPQIPVNEMMDVEEEPIEEGTMPAPMEQTGPMVPPEER